MRAGCCYEGEAPRDLSERVRKRWGGATMETYPSKREMLRGGGAVMGTVCEQERDAARERRHDGEARQWGQYPSERAESHSFLKFCFISRAAFGFFFTRMTWFWRASEC